MKQLILIRHAKSSWKHPELDDHERPLNNRGLRNAPFMGERMARAGVKPELIISSTAARARKTARLVAAELDYSVNEIIEKGEIYHATWLTLLLEIQSLPQEKACIVMVGHNPGLTTLAQHLANVKIADLPTGAVVRLEFDASDWKELEPHSGDLLELDYPKRDLLG